MTKHPDDLKFPEVDRFDVGDPALAKEIARRWNSFNDLKVACQLAFDVLIHQRPMVSQEDCVHKLRLALDKSERKQP